MNVTHVIKVKVRNTSKGIVASNYMYGIDIDNLNTEAKIIHWDLTYLKGAQCLQFIKPNSSEMVQFNKEDLLNYNADEIILKIEGELGELLL